MHKNSIEMWCPGLRDVGIRLADSLGSLDLMLRRRCVEGVPGGFRVLPGTGLHGLLEDWAQDLPEGLLEESDRLCGVASQGKEFVIAPTTFEDVPTEHVTILWESPFAVLIQRLVEDRGLWSKMISDLADRMIMETE